MGRGKRPGNADQIHELIRKIQANEPVPEEQKRLISPGVTMGGARPKALLNIEGEQWVIKFADGDPTDAPLIEHASMTLAAKAGIRFDRNAGARVHSMAFNILMDNTDDHQKNHALLVTDAQQYELSPAYDVLPSGQALGFQQMRIGEEEADSTLANALSMARMFSLDKDDAVEEIRSVASVVGKWKAHFKSCGVTRGYIELYVEQIDRPFLRNQRSEFLGRV